MINITVNSGNTEENIKNIINGLSNFRKPMKTCAEILSAEIKENFDRQGALYQGGGFYRTTGSFNNFGFVRTYKGAWKPLQPRTKAERKKLGFPPSRPILIRTGKLKDGFHARLVGNNGFEIYNNVPYAKTHQYGDETRHIPQRSIMGITNKSAKAINVTLLNYIKGVIIGGLKQYG